MIAVHVDLPVLEHDPLPAVAALLGPRPAVVLVVGHVAGRLVDLTELAVQLPPGAQLGLPTGSYI